MKKVLLILAMAFFALHSYAQFSKARLQATGLTCAMCSNAINKALEKISFVESVKSDIKNSAFNIEFKQGADVNMDALKDAVEDAGFFVGGFQVTGVFTEMKIDPDKYAKIGNYNFHFLNVSSRILNGEITLKVLDKSYLTAKEFKKLSSSVKAPCLQTGKADGTHIKDGVTAGERVYHVTI